MMCKRIGVALAALSLAGGGCSTHLLFSETSHGGLKARFSADNPVPYEVDIGYRRGMLVAIPIKQAAPDVTPEVKPAVSAAPTSAGESDEGDVQNVVVIQDDPQELMSLYSTFRANIGFGAPTKVRHFLATGRAATHLLARRDDLRKLDEVIGPRERAVDSGGDAAPPVPPAGAPPSPGEGAADAEEGDGR